MSHATIGRAYARQAKHAELEAWVAEIRRRARRRVGELSAELEQERGPGRGSTIQLPSNGKLKSEVLKEDGLTTSVANRCEHIARVLEEDFEHVIAERKDQRRPITADDMVRVLAKEQKRDAPLAQAAMQA